MRSGTSSPVHEMAPERAWTESAQLRHLFGRRVQGFLTNDRVIPGLSNPRFEHLRQADCALL
jgi:hypothetical protein